MIQINFRNTGSRCKGVNGVFGVYLSKDDTHLFFYGAAHPCLPLIINMFVLKKVCLSRKREIYWH